MSADRGCARCGAAVGLAVATPMPVPVSTCRDDAPTGLPGASPLQQDDRLPLAAGQSFGSRYHIIRLLGVGGMGAVYQAWDTNLSVAVAIKVIRPEVTADPAAAADIAQRFKRELVLARQVTHKNVVRIHDLGEIDGIPYITMAYVEGSDLATLLARQRLPVERVMRIAHAIVSGLSAAHAAGVIHRDLKPANIMIGADDEALIMDFGIARSTTADAAALAPTATAPGQGGRRIDYAAVTSAGFVVGTAEYMSPEQARGRPADQRSDVYAFGLMLYDMLSGRRRAADAASAATDLQSRMTQPPPRVRSLVPGITEALDQIVSRCVDPDPAKRFQTTADLAAALDRLDAHGLPLPVRRMFGVRVLASIVILAFTLLGIVGWYARRQQAAPEVHEPVSVLIADFQNNTGDTSLDGALEPMLKLALEGASFVSAYDRTAVSRSLGVRPPERFDERAAQELAIKQGLGIVLSGVLTREGSRYGVAVKATHAVTGNVLTRVADRASNKQEILGVATKLATSVRQALGDRTSTGADQRFAMETLSATSLEAVRDYAAGAQSMSSSRFEEALQHFSKAVERDPRFGLAYAGMASASRNLDRQQDAERYSQEAVRYVDGMTERERYRTRGMFYMVTGDHQQCSKEFGELIARYAADASARNNLAVCLTLQRNITQAVEEMRQVVKILPKRPLYRENLGHYTNYSGDFATAERDARAMEHPSAFGQLVLAFAQLGQGQVSPAAETYESLGKVDSLGASYAASGLGDLALYEGRFADAMRILTDGAATDDASNDPDRAANKLAALAYTQLLRQQKPAAIAAADAALARSQAPKIRFLAARVFVQAGATERVRALARDLAAELQTEPQAYAKIIEGDAALAGGNSRDAIRALTEANALLDTWIGHFDLGRAYLLAEAYTQADSEFDRCLTRRGEALALFLDEEPTYGYLPPVYYYQGRAREGLKTSGFAESYRAYLAIRGHSKEDPLLPEIRRRTQ